MKENSLSKILWGVDWEVFNNTVITDEVLVQVVSYQEFISVVNPQYHAVHLNPNDLFTVSNNMKNISENKIKEKFYALTSDFFLFKHEGISVGWFAATVADWSTYYLRSSGVIPQFQKKGIYKTFVEELLNFLKSYPIDRITAEVSPANIPVIKTLSKFNFNITGHINTERWGSLVHLTKFISPQCEVKFLKQFCSGLFPQLENISNE